jgi:hypothetical protein
MNGETDNPGDAALGEPAVRNADLASGVQESWLRPVVTRRGDAGYAHATWLTGGWLAEPTRRESGEGVGAAEKGPLGSEAYRAASRSEAAEIRFAFVYSQCRASRPEVR